MENKTLDKPHQYIWLDLIRGLAALAVFLGHLRVMCLVDTPVNQLSLFGKLLFFVTGFGHIAVVVFFVLSGFLIIKSIDGAYQKHTFTVKKYAIDRLSRLWVVLIPCLFLGLLFDSLGLHYLKSSLLYSGEFKYFYHVDLAPLLSAKVFLMNVFFLQNLVTPTYGTNQALWSLSFEFWYYVSFPFFYLSMSRRIPVKYRVLLFIGGGIVLACVGFEIALQFALWLCGGLSYLLTKKVNKNILQNRWLRYVSVVLFIVFLVATRWKIVPIVFNQFTIAFFFALAIPFLVNNSFTNKIGVKISSYLSNISYTLYVAHIPFLCFVTALFNFQSQVCNLHNYLVYLVFSVGILLYCTLVWFLFERNTAKVKAYLFPKKKAPAA